MNRNDHLPDILFTPMSLYVVATGAGAGIQNRLWGIPGCSTFFRGASFPYSPDESTAFAGLTPASYVSRDFALDLAMGAYTQAIDLKNPDKEPVGLALTGSVATTKAHRGDHRVEVVCMTRTRVLGLSVILAKGEGYAARLTDGATSDGLALEVLLSAVIPGYQSENVIDNLDEAARKRFFENPVFQGGRRLSHHKAGTFFPGAFNPPHEGHEAIATNLHRMGQEPTFAICANPPHKAALSVQEMLGRAKTLQHRTVLFTENDPLYIDKAKAYPGSSFVIGADALVRMLDPKWGPTPEQVCSEFKALQTHFYVFGREINGTFMEGTNVIASLVPEGFADLFTSLRGRWDVSSTVIRQPSHTGSHGSGPTHSEDQPNQVH